MLLIGGDKTGNPRFYDEIVPRAETIWERYLRESRVSGQEGTDAKRDMDVSNLVEADQGRSRTRSDSARSARPSPCSAARSRR